MSNYYTDVNPDLLARLPLTAARVLEIGCGAGNLGRAYKARNPGVVYMGVELFEAAAVQARDQLDHVLVGDIEQVVTVAALDAALAGAKVDVLVFGDVLEHLRDPWAVLAALRERMSPSGVCVACIPNVAHWSLLAGQIGGKWDYADSGLLDRTHLRFFTLDSAEAMFRQAGWSVADSCPRLLSPEKTEAALKAFAPAAESLGANLQVMRRNLSAFQWLIRAVNAPASPASLQLSAMTVTKSAGMVETRIEEPLAALATQPSIVARWAAETLEVPRKGQPGVLIFQRQFFESPALVAGLNQVAGRGWALVSEMDDDPRARPGFVANDFLAFKAVHAVTVTTEPLARIMRQWNPNVVVLPNAVASLTPASPTTPKQDGRLRVFFGAINRADDWAPLMAALNAVVAPIADRLQMVVVHDRAFHDALSPVVSREFHQLLPYDRYKAVLATCDIALLPLADTAFNRNKSDLKLIECLAAGVVPICSSVVYADDPRNAEAAVFADGAQPFAAALGSLCVNPQQLTALRAKGLAYVSAERMQAQQVAAREAFYRGLLSRHAELEAQRRERLAKVTA